MLFLPKSGNKEAAGAFLQTLLTEDYQNSLVDGFGGSGFPILKSALELQFEKDMTPEYYTDEKWRTGGTAEDHLGLW